MSPKPMNAIDAQRPYDPIVREILGMQAPEGMRPSLLRQYDVASACVEHAYRLARMIARWLAPAAHAAKHKSPAPKPR